ncbi:unnamed protein product [Linum tenue]|uniref:EamA domain-containing protein n=1 Tax=Linum tenue TaxID=586396 RepID=A0AAV0IGU3_9ROSI|nr:unnamed protein product [Linum tenue]
MQVQFVISMFAAVFCTVPMIINRDFQVICSTAGLVTSFLVPTQQVFAVIFLREGFDAEKGMALAMCLWGFASHLYGEHKAAATSDNKQPTPRNHGDQEDSPADV